MQSQQRSIEREVDMIWLWGWRKISLRRDLSCRDVCKTLVLLQGSRENRELSCSSAQIGMCLRPSGYRSAVAAWAPCTHSDLTPLHRSLEHSPRFRPKGFTHPQRRRAVKFSWWYPEVSLSLTNREQDPMELRFCLAWLFTADVKGASPSSGKKIPTVYGRDTGANCALVYSQRLLTGTFKFCFSCFEFRGISLLTKLSLQWTCWPSLAGGGFLSPPLNSWAKMVSGEKRERESSWRTIRLSTWNTELLSTHLSAGLEVPRTASTKKDNNPGMDIHNVKYSCWDAEHYLPISCLL